MTEPHVAGASGQEPIVALAAIDPARDARFGGKAVGLARLLRAGARVPQGFAVEAGTVDPRWWPRDLLERFAAACAQLLRAGPLAVRSSALVEDQRERSFAGLFETVLGVDSVDAALDAAVRCVASGTSERVLAYAGGGEPLAVGVVVQNMIAARAAGTLFTRDPQGSDCGLVLEAVVGLGDRLVSGRARPERWRIYRSGIGVWESRRETLSSSGVAPVLDRGTVEELATLASRFADALGEPLDLEWALAPQSAGAAGSWQGGPPSDATTPSLFWLQARPITAMTDPPRYAVERSVPDADDGPITVWSSWNVRETMPDPLHPLTWSLWRETIVPFLTERFFGVPRASPIFHEVNALDRVQGRVVFNLNAMLAVPFTGRLVGPILQKVDYRAGAVVKDLVARGILTPRRLRGLRGAPSLVALGNLARAAPGSLRALRPERCLADLATAAARVSGRPAVESLGARDLLRELRLWESPEAGALRDGMQMLSVAVYAWLAAERLFAPWPEAQRLLAAGIRGNPTTEISLRIDDLVAAARPVAPLFAEQTATPDLLAALREDASGRAWLARLDDFLAFCGQRGPREFDLAVPRWSDDPTMILDLVRLGLAESARETVAERLRRLEAQRRHAVDAAVRSAPRWKRPLLRALAGSVARLMPLREAPKHYGLHVFQRMRRAALELGRRLAAAGALARVEDVFFLELAELERLAPALDGAGAPDQEIGRQDLEELAARIEERRRLLDDFHRRPAPHFLRSDGVPVIEEALDDALPEGWLQGTGVSSGEASGVARVLDRPDAKAFRQGDVLVVAFADPGWTPLFPRAAALVMEVGGAMCHAAVVARELGIPAVFGVSGATALLAGGQRVSVDGSSGVIRLLDSP